MGRDACDASAAARAVFDAADSTLGFSLSKLCFEGPEEDLRRTEIQQPAILTTSIALLRALEERTTVKAAFAAGHSLGEYSALVAAGSLSFEDAVALVHARGRFMQEAVPEGRGAMAAVMGAGPEAVTEACERASRESGRIVSAANYNSPQQTVIAGDSVAVEMACLRAKELGAKRSIGLPVSAPFHCQLMQPAADKLALELERVRFGPCDPPVITNVRADLNADGAAVPALLREQVTAPVRFTEMVERMVELGVDHFLEIGPGSVLSGLVARIHRRSKRQNVSVAADLDEAVAFLGGSADG